MRESISIFVLILLFSTVAFLSGFKSESTSSGCYSAPDVTIVRPSQDENIENPPVSIEFTAIQDSVDLTAIDLNSVTAIIRDNMNKTIDITRYILSSCDILKKNCTFKGEVDLEAGEYILEVRVCNTTAACEMKEVRFTVFPINQLDWISKISDFIKRLRCNASIFGSGCGKTNDEDNDCLLNNIEGCDNCPGSPNPDQADMDKDGIGDKCDDDIDGDGLLNDFEDRIGTKKDNPDSDNDGLIDSDELRFGTDPNNPDTNGDGISDYDQIVSGVGCKPLGVVLQNSTTPKRIPDACIPSDSNNDGCIDAVYKGECNYDLIKDLIYPVWVVNQNWYGDSDIEFYSGYEYDSGRVKYIFNYEAEARNINYGVVKSEYDGKIPNKLKFTNGTGDIFTAIKTRDEGSGELARWYGVCKSDKTEYIHRPSCCLDDQCKNKKTVTIRVHVQCSVDPKYDYKTNNKFRWENTIISYDLRNNNMKAHEIYFMEDPANYNSLQGYKIWAYYSCRCDDCDGCRFNPCRNEAIVPQQTIEYGKYELMLGNGLGYLMNEREEIRQVIGGCKIPYSYSIPSFYFTKKDGFKIYRYMQYNFPAECIGSEGLLGYRNFTIHNLIESWKPLKITLPSEEDNNKYVYLRSSPPRLEIRDLKSSIEWDNELSDYWKNYLRWNIDPIDDSHNPSVTFHFVTINWNSYWDNDGRYGRGATNSLYFQGMPRHNSDFGPKKLRFEMIDPSTYPLKNDPIVLDEREIKIFFPKDDNYHPYLEGDQLNTPNWYYYWGQEVPPLTSRYYSSEPNVQCGEYTCVGEWKVDPNDYTTKIIIYDDAKASYYYCTQTLVHENQHEADWKDVWPNGYDPNEDLDEDWLRDSWEMEHELIVPNHPHWSEKERKSAWKNYENYTEYNASIAEKNYNDQSQEKDWACPGTNCDY